MKPFPPLADRDLAHIRDHTAELWEEARGKNFFITGGTGFFGIWLLESFAHINDSLGLDAKVTVLSRDPTIFARKVPHISNRRDITFIQGDVRDFQSPEGKFDFVIHAATEASAKLNHERPDEMLDSIVSGMHRILDFAAEADVSKLLFTSSGAVYGKQPSDSTHLSEEFSGAPDCLDPSSAYGEGKRVAELMVAIHSKQYPCEMKIARCFAFVGPHLPLDTHFAIGNFIRDARANNPIRISGDGSPYRSYLYAADLAIWLWTILFKGISLRPYNVGSQEGYSISDLAHIVTASIAPELSVEIAKAPVPGAAPLRYVPAVSRAGNELGLSEKIALPDALKRTAEWLT
jgi:nucleoside-diphosphate-sugar epimerase